ncbi:His Kinase A (phospho-acceptor) domain-containing protein [Nocardioides scoriae]|uniref:histidine kinase n=1 Tax=Nocardioides scoriae TaxID=642780 RepID=A0A1H1UN36_9ACTN|nr:HAMP domain-containing sensor histidine kinase [Nocardioides scoriae]SDS73944.1 His Kinase A (phospho-acceptor) domain-containing protein [Nocardioides scoriae]
MTAVDPRSATVRDRVVLGAGALVLLALLALSSVVVLGDHRWGPVTSDSVAVVTSAFASACTLYAARRSSGAMRRSWLLLCAMILLNTVGATQWLAAGGSEGDRALSWADALYLVAAVPAAYALVGYPMAIGLGRAWRAVLLDALVVGSSALLVSTLLGLSEVARTLTGTRAFVFLVYPVMDVLILSLVAALLLRGTGRVRADVALIGLSFCAFAVADQGFALSSVRGEDLGLEYLLGYVVAALLLAGAALAAATLDTRSRVLERHLSGPVAPLLPDLAAFVALGAALVAGIADDVQATLAAVVLALTGLRQLRVTTHNLGLRRDLERRVAERTEELCALTAEHARLDGMKQEFVSAVSHELRTPLTAIRGSLELLVDGDAGELPERARPVVEMASRGSERLSRLVDDIIDLDRLQSGDFGFDPASHDVFLLLTDAAGSLAPLAREAGVSLSVEPVEARVVCDGDRVTQAVVNLLGNALKFTPPGGSVTVSTTCDGDAWRVSVTDTGRGIPATELDAIFDRFHQVEPDDARQHAGTGLGLSITRRIVEANGGRIWVESECGTGSTFHFTLPLGAAGSPPVGADAPGPQAPEPRRRADTSSATSPVSPG